MRSSCNEILIVGLENKEVGFQIFIINISEIILVEEVDLFKNICLKVSLKDGGMRYFNHVRVSAGKLVEVNRIIDFYRILEKL